MYRYIEKKGKLNVLQKSTAGFGPLRSTGRVRLMGFFSFIFHFSRSTLLASSLPDGDWTVNMHIK